VRSRSRTEIFADLRRALGVTGVEAPRRRSVAERLEHAPHGVIPVRGRIDGAARIALFRAEAERVLASVVETASPPDVAPHVATYLRNRDLPLRLGMGADPLLATLPWRDIKIQQESADGTDRIGLSRAFGAVAESGTLVLVSGDANPTRLNFLPETHIVVVTAADIVGSYEEIWQKLRAAYGKGGMPRSVNFITGPSRSADIGQKMQLGAHGPRDLHIIIVGV
jgi:L-lactate dehydrogenase complex protein LldG